MTTSDSIHAVEEALRAQQVAQVESAASSAPPLLIGDTVFLKVSLNSTDTNVRLSFDPVTVEEMRQTREVNRSIRLGFVPPTVSTR